MERPSGAVALDPGSFRDRHSRIVRSGDEVLRLLSPAGLADFERLAATRFYADAVERGTLIASERSDDERPELADALPEGVAGVLRHERVPFVSYPYEWPFSMLRDAALLQLDLLDAALAEGMTLKDASSYNVQWRGARPVFIDVGSFRPLEDGEPWVGYRQFCMLFYYPLLLQARLGLEFQPWLRGRLDGITPGEARRMLPLRHRLRRGAFTHVALHGRLEEKYARSAGAREQVRRANISREMVRRNVAGLRRHVERLRWAPGESAWSTYADVCTYTDAETEQKSAFVERAVAAARPGLVWDVGCNDGRYSRIAARHADHVVAMDLDQLTVDTLYRSLAQAGETRVLPLTVRIDDPSPEQGWRLRERRSLHERGRPDLVLALAVLHHISIAGNVPLPEAVDWLGSLGASVVVEFVRREDPMARRLLSQKDATHPDYDEDVFERALAGRFEVAEREELAGGTRVLYYAHPRRG